MIKYLCIALAAGGALAVAEEKGPDLATARAEFQKHDAALNRLYAELKKELRPTEFALVQEDQRGWVDYKEYVAEGQARFEGVAPAESASYWATAAGMTEARLRYLSAWRGVGERGSWTGEYSDGRGGLLEMVETEEGLYFTLQVVRGPTFHLGTIGGLATVNGHLARFSTALDDEEGRECWVSFLNDLNGDGRIVVATAKAQHFHGARAYFDNAYLRVGLLDAERQARVIRAAKEGGEAE